MRKKNECPRPNDSVSVKSVFTLRFSKTKHQEVSQKQLKCKRLIFFRRKYRVNIPASALWQENWSWLIRVRTNDAVGSQITGLFWQIQKLCHCSLVESHSSDQKWISLRENWNRLCKRKCISAFICSLPPLFPSPLGRQGRKDGSRTAGDVTNPALHSLAFASKNTFIQHICLLLMLEWLRSHHP